MALLANDPADRAEQLLMLSERLAVMAEEANAALTAGDPLGGAPSDEFLRLANAYRNEMARVREDPSLLAGLNEPLRRRLRDTTAALQEKLDRYTLALNAVRTITEGLLQAIAEELQKDARASAGYGASGGYAAGGAAPLALDKRA